jgi:hypothetical protein
MPSTPGECSAACCTPTGRWPRCRRPSGSSATTKLAISPCSTSELTPLHGSDVASLHRAAFGQRKNERRPSTSQASPTRPFSKLHMRSWALGDWASTTRLNSGSAGAETLSDNGQEKSADAMNALRFAYLGANSFLKPAHWDTMSLTWLSTYRLPQRGAQKVQ